MPWAIMPGGRTVSDVVAGDPAGRFHPSWPCAPCGGDVRPGWTASLSGRTWTFAAPQPPSRPAVRYVSLAVIRERVTAAGKWSAFAQALDALPAEKRWHLATLAEGVATHDPHAVALLAPIGSDPAAVLA